MGHYAAAFTLSLCFLLLFKSLPAHAAEKLAFDTNIRPSSKLMIQKYLGQRHPENASNVSIARADLNDDGIDEFFIRDDGCFQSREISGDNCGFEIVAERSDKILSLGTIKARRVMLGNGYTNGIRNLLAYASMMNDYEYNLYIWDAKQSVYVVAE